MANEQHSGIVITDRRGRPVDMAAARPAAPARVRSGTVMGPGRTRSRVAMNEQLSLTVSTVWRCCELISNAITMMPVHVREWDGDRQVTTDGGAVSELLDVAPNPEMSARQFKILLTFQMLLWGNGFAAIARNEGDGRIQSLWPLHPSEVELKRDEAGALVYEHRPESGAPQWIPAESMFHIKGPSPDGLWGYSRVNAARETLASAKATELYGASYFGNSGTPSGVIENDDDLDEEDIQMLERNWIENFVGVDAAGKVAVLLPGQSFKPLSIPPNDMQFLQTRTFHVNDIAPRWFGVPGPFVGDMSKATFNNFEQLNIQFVTFAVLPVSAEFENEARIKMLGHDSRRSVRFEPKGLIRGDLKTRAEFYRRMREIGVFSSNDILKSEDLEPIGEAGDVRIAPLNYQNLEDLMRPLEERRGRRQTARAEAPPRRPAPPAATALLFGDVADRTLARCEKAAARRAHLDDGAFADWLAPFAADTGPLVRAARPVVRSVAAMAAGVDAVGAAKEHAMDWALERAAREHADRVAAAGRRVSDSGWIGEERAALLRALQEIVVFVAGVGARDEGAG